MKLKSERTNYVQFGFSSQGRGLLWDNVVKLRQLDSSSSALTFNPVLIETQSPSFNHF